MNDTPSVLITLYGTLFNSNFNKHNKGASKQGIR